MLEDHKEAIQREWESGCHNASAIFRVLQRDGYTGCYTLVKDHLRAFRHESDGPVRQDASVSMPVE